MYVGNSWHGWHGAVYGNARFVYEGKHETERNSEINITRHFQEWTGLCTSLQYNESIDATRSTRDSRTNSPC